MAGAKKKKSVAQVKKETLGALGIKAPGKRTIWAPVVDKELKWGEATLTERAWEEELNDTDSVSNFAVKVADRPKVRNIFTTIEKNFDPKKVAVFTNLLGASFNIRASEHLEALLDALGQSKNLHSLELHWLRVPIPAAIGKLTELRALDIPGMSVIDPYMAPYPAELWKLSKLEVLRLGAHGFEALPKEIGQLANLQSLHLAGCRNLAKLPKLKLERLESIDLGSGNQLTSAHAIPILAELPNLRFLRLRSSLPGGTPPAALGKMKNLQFLSIGASALPKETAKLESLIAFDAAWSALETIPPSFAELPNFKTLQVEQTAKLDVAGTLDIALKSKSLRWLRWDVTAIDAPKAKRLLDAGWRQIKYGGDDIWTKLE